MPATAAAEDRGTEIRSCPGPSKCSQTALIKEATPSSLVKIYIFWHKHLVYLGSRESNVLFVSYLTIQCWFSTVSSIQGVKFSIEYSIL